MRKTTKLIAVLSAAAMMSMASPNVLNDSFLLNVYAANGWVQEDSEWHFYDEDGYLESNTWKKRGSDWYYLDDDGNVTVNQRVDEYYVDSEGKMVKNKWVSPEGEETYDSPDSASDQEWNYFDKSGKIVTSRWMAIQNNWHYFDEDGKLVVNQIDRKIDGAFYTFENGQMQTGWVKTEKTAEGEADSPASYQYYDEEQGGKRASGWYQIEGIEGISEEGEEYYFYFKNGKPYYSQEAGLELFNINSERYAFNEKGEMQTGVQTLAVKGGGEAVYYFGDDGAMKTGKQTIYDEDAEENQTWYFYPSGSKKGQGYTGERDNRVYVNGLMKKADPELRYEPVAAGDRTYLVNTSGTIQKASSSSTSDAKPELLKGFKDYKDSNDTVWTVDTNGIIQ